jgi:hypothetical protein
MDITAVTADTASALHPATASLVVEGVGHREEFTCSHPADWANALQWASGQIVEAHVNGRPMSRLQVAMHTAAAKGFARMVKCYDCKTNLLDPDATDAFGLELCQSCYDASGLENEHCDGYHDDALVPVPGCPVCAECGPGVSTL